MKKQIFLWAIALLISNGLAAQQLGQHSQYQQNPFVLNPAAAGIEPYLDITLSYRKQWTGIEGSPQTYYASANTSLTKFKKPSYKPASLRISKPNRYNRYDPKRKLDRKSTRLNSSHQIISYAVFCLKKKKKKKKKNRKNETTTSQKKQTRQRGRTA